VFADPVRRTALAVLDDTSTPTSLETLAYGIESDPEADVACVDACSVALHHRHLPILDEAGLVDYDPPTNTIRSCHGSVRPSSTDGENDATDGGDAIDATEGTGDSGRVPSTILYH